ncbi:hypothetical protein GCM10023149_22920 [Mucilaginibacter gynuensis]|uniref:LamG-like jellyroll fold domain-containing protein n=1 Tax=Mucilaginibacter gynuensis TaxID=1302236 RepID=A0ABP8GEL3_9SPHI
MKQHCSTLLKIKLFLLPVLLFVMLQANAQPAGENHLQYVNPFIGSAKSDVPTRWGSAGGTYPGAVAPSGVIQLSPETRLTGARGYNYADSVIYFFSFFGHMSGFPEGSAGKLHIMPVGAASKLTSGNYNRRFTHADETASPGYYKATFNDDNTIAEATVTARTGMFRFTFSKGNQPQIFIADAGELIFPSKTELHAVNRNTVLLFSEAYTAKQKLPNGWLFTFAKATAANKVLTIKLSTSTIDHASAKHNIESEIGKQGFDAVRTRTVAEWAKKLSVVDVEDNNEQNKTVFYTALYHSLLIPWVIDDADGRYKGGDGKICKRSGANQYGAFSPWDTFRSLHPLLTLLYPDKQQDVILSMLDIYKQTGYLPIESMTGNHSIPVLVDSYLKGITGFDKVLAYKAMKKSIVDGPFLQKDMVSYHNNGYIPFMFAESVTRTVEYAYDDWALSQFAKNVMHDDATYKLTQKRGYNYRNLFNTDDRLFLPRNQDAVKLQPGMSGYKEGDKWVYGYFVPHNVQDLINYTGGAESFAERLDSVLTNEVLFFDNETVFHVPYLFNQAGMPWLTQKWCSKIMLERFGNSPGGLPGNDDLGSTSSWYVFSAMGIYPSSPGRPCYSIGTPLFKSVTAHLPNKNKLTVTSDQKGPYVQSVRVNNADWQQLIIPHDILSKGGTIAFNTADKPTGWPRSKLTTELSVTKVPAVFTVRSFAPSLAKVLPNELFYVRFSLTNEGSKGLKKVIVLKDGQPYAYKNCLVEQGVTVKDSIGIKLYATGKHALAIDGLKPVSVEVLNSDLKPDQAFDITSLTVKPMVKLNEEQLVQYTIQNIDGKPNTYYLPILRNDTLLMTDTVSINPGEKKELKHILSTTHAGFQQMSVSGKRIVYKVYNHTMDALLLQLSPVRYTANGLLADSSGFNNNGHIVSAKPVKSGKLLFDESTHIEVPNAAALDEMDESLSMMGWVFPTGSERGLVDIITKGDSHVLQVTDQKTLTFFAGGWGRGDCTVKLPANWKSNWHHIAGVCNGKKLELYIDGILAGTTIADENANLSNTSKWFLGQNEEFPGERIFHGRLDKVKVYKSSLSAAEVKAIFTIEQKIVKNSN